jgi:signal transduction histidine kinase
MNNKFYNLLPYIILLICLSASIFIWKNIRDIEAIKIHDRFESISRQTITSIKERLATYTDAHYAGAAIFLTSEEVTREDWRKFVNAIKINTRYPGINGIGFAIPVKKAELPNLLHRIRVKDSSAFRVTFLNDTANAQDHFIIRFIEPIVRNKEALGFDMGSESKRRIAMETARDSAKPIISKMISLVQDNTQSPGFLLYVPFYKNGLIPVTLEERRTDFVGWIYAPFITKDFLEGILNHNLAEIRTSIAISIYSEDTSNEKNLMFRSENWLNVTPQNDTLNKMVTLNLYKQNWKVLLRPTNEFLRLYQSSQGIVVLFICLLLSFALFYIALLLAKTRNNAIELAEEMTKELKLKNIESQKQNLELERSNRDLEQFAYVASHDLKEPLRMINIYLQRLGENIKIENEAARESLNFISEGAKRMNILIQDLLEYARLGHNVTTKSAIDLNKVLQQVKFNLKPFIEIDHVSIISENLPTIFAVESNMTSLFQNIIQNGIKFKKTDVDPVIKVSVNNKNGISVFSIEDNGIGLQQEYAEKIFILFQRLHNKDSYQGTGIGLAICKKIVEMYDGKIWVESKVGEGTCVKFTLPLAFKPVK